MKTEKRISVLPGFCSPLIGSFFISFGHCDLAKLDSFIPIPTQLSHCWEEAKRPWGGEWRRWAASEINPDAVILQSVRV